jgi:hypothetical protein
MLRVKLIKIAHYDQCVLIEIAATLALNQFQQRYTQEMIINDPHLQSEETRLTAAKTKAWNDRFAAESAAYPPTLESILWIVAKSGYTKEVAPFMNLSKATRECKNLQQVMREVKNKWEGTQLHYFCWKGMTSSVMRMLEMRSIDVEAKLRDEVGGDTCLHTAAREGHLDICRLLIDKGAQMEAKNNMGYTPLHCAARSAHVDVCRLLIDKGAQIDARDDFRYTPLHWAAAYRENHLDIVRLLCDRGADIEARNDRGCRPLHYAAKTGHISVVKVLIDVRNAEINARDDDGKTALSRARNYHKAEIAAYLISLGGIE